MMQPLLVNSLSLVVSLMLVCSISGCGDLPMDTTSDESLARSALLVPRGKKGSGFLRLEGSKPRHTIDYQYYPVGIIDAKREIGRKLAYKIRNMYDAADYFESVRFRIHLPYEDPNRPDGEPIWAPAFEFTVTRTIFDRIDWDDFNTNELVSMSRNVRDLKRMK
jgi:hypothetical protein